jgi:SAM-dependent methyltransferase
MTGESTMNAARSGTVGDKYVLPTGASDAARLDVIHEVYAPVSLRGIEAAGIGAARRAADIGCGTGTMSRLMAERMGDGAVVDAIDISEDQVAVARGTAASPGAAEIRYAVASAYEPGLPEGEYDVVFVRLLLCHLKDREGAMRSMARLLRPGGRLVAVDMDMYSTRALPAGDAYPRFLQITRKLESVLGTNYEAGHELPDLFRGAGLATSFLCADQPIYGSGPGKTLWERTWRSALPNMAKAGVSMTGEAEAVLDAMAAHNARPDVWIAVAKMFACVGVKP